jgi:hypothetical protein
MHNMKRLYQNEGSRTISKVKSEKSVAIMQRQISRTLGYRGFALLSKPVGVQYYFLAGLGVLGLFSLAGLGFWGGISIELT